MGNTAACIIAANGLLILGIASRFIHGNKGPSDLSFLVFSVLGGTGTIYCVYVAASVIKNSTTTGVWPEPRFWFGTKRERDRKANVKQAIEVEIRDRLEKQAKQPQGSHEA